jgi:hypothetical protein
MREERSPQYLRARTIETDADLSAPTEGLWRIHDYFATGEQKETAVTTASLLDLKIEIAQVCVVTATSVNAGATPTEQRGLDFAASCDRNIHLNSFIMVRNASLCRRTRFFSRAARLSALSVKTGISHDMRRRVRSLMPMHLHGESTHDQSQEPAT